MHNLSNMKKFMFFAAMLSFTVACGGNAQSAAEAEAEVVVPAVETVTADKAESFTMTKLEVVKTAEAEETTKAKPMLKVSEIKEVRKAPAANVDGTVPMQKTNVTLSEKKMKVITTDAKTKETK